MIKTFYKPGIDGNALMLIKGIYKTPTVNVTLTDRRLNAFPQDQEQGRGVYFYHLHSTLHWRF